MKSRAFTAHGQPLALNPRAFGMLVFEPPAPPEARDAGGGVHLVSVHGPLMHHEDPFCDSYDAIKARVLGALDAGARTVVLAIDSPGGLLSGMIDTAVEIRAACDERRAQLLTYVDGQATSAAYALGCVAHRIFVPSTGIVGSIGVVCEMVDQTKADGAMGLRVAVIASGARKADGNPHSALTDDAMRAEQERVDALALIFFEHVSAHRGLPIDKIAALQAGLVHGAQATSLGLADEVATLDQVLSLARAGGVSATTVASQQESLMDENEKAVRAALQAILDGDGDEKAKARAQKALAAMDEGEPDGDEEHVEPDGDEAAQAAAPAQAQATAALARTANTLEARLASVEAQLEGEQKSTLRALRPDVAASVHDALAVLPLTAYRSALAKIEKPKRAAPAATAQVAPTMRGEGQGGNASVSTSKTMAQAMGLADRGDVGVVHKADVVVFNARRSAANGGVR